MSFDIQINNIALKFDNALKTHPGFCVNFENNNTKLYGEDVLITCYDILKNKIDSSMLQIFLDVGANIGVFSCFFAKSFPNIEVHAFEPVKITTEYLAKNVNHNNLQNVVVNNFGLSDKKSKTIIKIPKNNCHMGLVTLSEKPLRFDEYDTEEIDVMSLDEYLGKNENYKNHLEIIFLKIDTEGWEYFVLLGGKNVIKQYHPIILIESNEINAKQCGISCECVFDLLKELGYTKFEKISHEDYLCE